MSIFFSKYETMHLTIYITICYNTYIFITDQTSAIDGVRFENFRNCFLCISVYLILKHESFESFVFSIRCREKYKKACLNQSRTIQRMNSKKIIPLVTSWAQEEKKSLEISHISQILVMEVSDVSLSVSQDIFL